MTKIYVYEDNAGAIYLHRDGDPTAWTIGPVGPDMEGEFLDIAPAWHSGEWDPSKDIQLMGSDSDPEVTLDALALLDHIATWTPQDGLIIIRDRYGLPFAGAAGETYLGLTEAD